MKVWQTHQWVIPRVVNRLQHLVIAQSASPVVQDLVRVALWQAILFDLNTAIILIIIILMLMPHSVDAYNTAITTLYDCTIRRWSSVPNSHIGTQDDSHDEGQEASAQ